MNKPTYLVINYRTYIMYATLDEARVSLDPELRPVLLSFDEGYSAIPYWLEPPDEAWVLD